MLICASILQSNRKILRWCRCISRSSKIKSEITVSKVKEVEIFALSNKPIFPGLTHIFNVDATVGNRFKNCAKENIYIGLFFSKKGENEKSYDQLIEGSEFSKNTKKDDFLRKDIDKVNDVDEIYEHGCVGLVKQVLTDESNEFDNSKENDSKLLFGMINKVQRIVVDVKHKIKIKRWKQENIAEIEIIKEPNFDSKNYKKLKIYQLELINKIKEMININKRNKKEYMFLIKYYDLKNVKHLINFIGNVSTSNSHVLQNMLQEGDAEKKLLMCMEIINEDLLLLQMEKELHDDLTEKFSKEKKEIIIKEYITQLKKKIGQKTEHQILYEHFLKKYENIKEHLCEDARLVITRELRKFSFLSENNSNEHSTIYQYLNTVFNIPFGKYSCVNKNVQECEQILNKNHYKMENAKRHVIEYLCVHILNKQIKPKILLLVGYPGIGKTSFGKSIAKGLHLPYDIIHMNNMFHLNELLGHRKTYVNSYEGKIIHSLINTKCMNPLIILDEFDKIAFSNFSIFNIFLNVFDANQNTKFKDLYIDFPVDISSVFFICTANTIENIPDVLLNRMEIVNLAPYTNLEKVHIFKNYLKHKIEMETQIGDDYIKLSDQLLLHIIHNYTNENGLRQFYNIIQNIYRRRAYLLLKGNKNLIIVDHNNLVHFLNVDTVRVQKSDRFLNKKAGTVTSLAFTELGGQIVTIEVSSYNVNFQKKGTYLSTSNSENFTWGDFNWGKQEQSIGINTDKGYDTFLNDPNLGSFLKEMRNKNNHSNYYNTCDIYNIFPKERRINFSTFPEFLMEHNNEIHDLSPTSSNFEEKKTESIFMDYYNMENFLKTSKMNLENPETKANCIKAKQKNFAEFYVDNKNSLLYKNASKNDNILITGNVGKVMEESIIIANTYATNLLKQIMPNFQKDHLHIHISECDIKKDGPSAGINFVTSILSFYLQIPIDELLTMTGEITLHGNILKIGGLIEKFIIAKNYGMHSIIIPKENKYEYESIVPDYMKSNISVYYVQHYTQVFNFLFGKRSKK